jgi:transposase InsO family protein
MEVWGWQTIYRRPRTTIPQPGVYKYPYLLKDLAINRVNQVWAMDITYVPMRRGYMYLCAIIDLQSRFVVNWSVSNTMTAEWCRQVAEDAIERYGAPEIFNTDQGSQFTSAEFTSLLETHKIQINCTKDCPGILTFTTKPDPIRVSPMKHQGQFMQRPKDNPLRPVTIVGATVHIPASPEQLLPSGVSIFYLNKRLYLS